MKGKVFVSEESREDFKDLCMEVFPLISGIERAVKSKGVEAMSSVTVGEDGYFNFYIHGSRWEMTRLGSDDPVKIKYGFSEELKVSDRIGYGKASENLIEISLAYADMIAANQELCRIDSITWKQQFVEWANEFEASWDDSGEYLEEIEKFARRKIAEYAKEN